MIKVGFIGSGNMATAIMEGMLHTKLLSEKDLAVYDISEEKRNTFRGRGIQAFDSVPETVECCEYIFLSVKPQVIPSVLEQMKECSREGKTFVSIAAGISGKYVQSILGENTNLILVMPNTPLLIGYGATAMSRMEPTPIENFEFVKNIFACAGTVCEIKPNQMNEVIPINGSSPAFIYRFAKLFVDQAVEMGFEAKDANNLFCASLIGSAHMMMESGKSHQELIDMVTSPGGTTKKGLEAMDREGFDQAVRCAIEECIQRAYEIGR